MTVKYLYNCIYHPADCSPAILPSGSNSSSGLDLVAVVGIDPDSMSIMHLVLRDRESPEIFQFNDTDLTLNNYHCNISKLEVFRGWNQTFEISHSGFYLSVDATVEVYVQMLLTLGQLK